MSQPLAIPAAEPEADSRRPAPQRFLVREVIRGVEVLSPRLAPRDSLVASTLAAELASVYHYGRSGPGGWLFVNKPEVHMGAEELVPDLAGWRRTRLPRLPDEAYFPVAPDWVCEVLSPSTEETDRSEKLDIYAEHGVRHVWLANPVLHTLEIYRLDEHGSYTRVRTCRGRRPVQAEPFDALPLDLALIWPE